MKVLLVPLRALYSGLLRLYPRSFQMEFAAEMELVFSHRIEAAASGGWLSLLIMFFREMRDYPRCVVNEHLRARRLNMSNLAFEGSTEPPTPWWALLAVAIFFVLPGTLGYLHLPWPRTGENSWISIVMVILVWVILFGPMVAGIKIGLPRWVLVYLGAIFGAFGVYGMVSIIGIFFGAMMVNLMRKFLGDSTLLARITWEWVNHFWFWLGIALVIMIFLGMLKWYPKTRKALDRIWADWTQISFLFYGAILIPFYIDFDEYQGEGLYVLGCLVALAVGAWVYLRVQHSGWRVIALLGGLTICMAIMGVGKYILVPLQDWPVWNTLHPPESERWFESLRTIASWFWPAVAIALPGLLQIGRNRRAAVLG